MHATTLFPRAGPFLPLAADFLAVPIIQPRPRACPPRKLADKPETWFFRCMQAVFLGVAAVVAALLPAQALGRDWWVYFGTYTGQGSRGIYVSRFDPIRGRLTPAQLAAEVPNPSFLALDSRRRFLYAVSELGNGQGGGGRVAAFAVDAKSGALRLLNLEASGGDGPCHVAVDRADRAVFVANYGSGSVAVLPVDQTGRLGPPRTVIQHAGSSVHPQRQRGPHAHQVVPSPDGAHLLACDLGLDQVRVYRWQSRTGRLQANDPPFLALPPGAGPRHLVFHPNRRWVYILNELNSTLSLCRWDRRTGSLEALATWSTLPEGVSPKDNTTAEVVIHPNGRFLYASNRGHDSLVMFSVDTDSGRLELLGHVSAEGRTPRHFTLDPTGRWCLVENQNSDRVAVFRVETGTGRLIFTGHVLSVPRPVCAVFAPVDGR